MTAVQNCGLFFCAFMQLKYICVKMRKNTSERMWRLEQKRLCTADGHQNKKFAHFQGLLFCFSYRRGDMQRRSDAYRPLRKCCGIFRGRRIHVDKRYSRVFKRAFHGHRALSEIGAYSGSGNACADNRICERGRLPLEFKSEGSILGTGVKLFSIAGPVIVYGTAASVVYGIIYYIVKLVCGV